MKKVIYLFSAVFLLLFFCKRDIKEPEYRTFKLNSIINGIKENGFFGHSIISIGDINNDGGEEIVIGADGDGTDMQGKIYLFYSNSIKDTINANSAKFGMEGLYRNDRLGWSLDSRCDINGDKIPDMVVGAIGCQKNGVFSGGVYIFYGKMENGKLQYKKVNAMIYGEKEKSYLGWYVNIHGDFNNDNINDIVISAPGYDENSGKVYVFYGRNFQEMTPASDADVVFIGENKNDRFGNSITILNDINGDNINDLLVTAFTNSEKDVNSGKIYIFYGKKFHKVTVASEADITITGEKADDYFGEFSATAGDLNNDGREDFLIGASGADVLYNEGGAVYLFRSKFKSKKISSSDADMTMAGLKNGSKIGSFILVPGDINGDGKTDLLVGGTGSDYKEDKGRVYFYSNERLLFKKKIPRPNRIIHGFIEGSRFGNSICSADIDGDGLKEILIGAYYDSSDGKNFGRVYIYKLEK